MSKNDELRYGAPGETAVHLCVDMQRIFAEGTEWKMPLAGTRPAEHPVDYVPIRKRRSSPASSRCTKPGQAVGLWRHYYERWGSMTIDRLSPEMIGLVPELRRYVPPARIFDKQVYAPWTGTDLHPQLRGDGIDTHHHRRRNRCLRPCHHGGAIDWGFRVILMTEPCAARLTKPTMR